MFHQCEGPSFTPRPNLRQNCSSMYCNFYIFRQQTRIQKILESRLKWNRTSVSERLLLLDNCHVPRILSEYFMCEAAATVLYCI
jgi:hypothetical protein